MINTTLSITQTGKKNLVKLTTISCSREIAAPVQKVWEVLAQPSHLEFCHPFCQKNPVETWPGAGSRDAVYFYSGKFVYRDFTRWLEGTGYNLHLTIPNLDTEAEVSFRVSQGQAISESVLTITIELYSPQYIPWILRWVFAPFVHASLKNYLTALLKGFDYYISTGQPVKRNQFGSHSIFSPVSN